MPRPRTPIPPPRFPGAAATRSGAAESGALTARVRHRRRLDRSWERSRICAALGRATQSAKPVVEAARGADECCPPTSKLFPPNRFPGTAATLQRSRRVWGLYHASLAPAQPHPHLGKIPDLRRARRRDAVRETGWRGALREADECCPPMFQNRFRSPSFPGGAARGGAAYRRVHRARRARMTFRCHLPRLGTLRLTPSPGRVEFAPRPVVSPGGSIHGTRYFKYDASHGAGDAGSSGRIAGSAKFAGASADRR